MRDNIVFKARITPMEDCFIIHSVTGKSIPLDVIAEIQEHPDLNLELFRDYEVNAWNDFEITLAQEAGDESVGMEGFWYLKKVEAAF